MKLKVPFKVQHVKMALYATCEDGTNVTKLKIVLGKH